MDWKIRQAIFNQTKEWIMEAGAQIRERMNDPITVNIKSNPNDLVTTIDQEIESFFVTKIKEHYPEDRILSEEGYGDQIESLEGTVWIIDPIDGTMNFVHQKRNFAISIGIYHKGIGEIGFIYDVMSDILYHAEKGNGAFKNNVKLNNLPTDIKLAESILGMNHRWLCANRFMDEKKMQELVTSIRGSRTYGSAALEFAYVAEGILDGYLAMRLAPWDIAAGVIIVQEVGGLTTNGEGNQIDLLKRNVIATCNKTLHQTIIEDYLKIGKK